MQANMYSFLCQIWTKDQELLNTCGFLLVSLFLCLYDKILEHINATWLFSVAGNVLTLTEFGTVISTSLWYLVVKYHLVNRRVSKGNSLPTRYSRLIREGRQPAVQPCLECGHRDTLHIPFFMSLNLWATGCTAWPPSPEVKLPWLF